MVKSPLMPKMPKLFETNDSGTRPSGKAKQREPEVQIAAVESGKRLDNGNTESLF